MAADKGLIAGAAALAKAQSKAGSAAVTGLGKAAKDFSTNVDLILKEQAKQDEAAKKQKAADLKNMASLNKSNASIQGVIREQDRNLLQGEYETHFSSGSADINSGAWNEGGMIEFQNRDNSLGSFAKNINGVEADFAAGQERLQLGVPSDAISIEDRRYKIFTGYGNSEYTWEDKTDGKGKGLQNKIRNFEGIGQVTDEEIKEAIAYGTQTKNVKQITDYSNTVQQGFARADSEFEAQSVITNILNQNITNEQIENLLTNVYDSRDSGTPLNITTLKNEEKDLNNEDEYNKYLKDLLKGQLEIDKASHYQEPPEDKIDEVDESRTSANNTANTMIGQLGKGVEGVTNFLTSFWEDPSQGASNTKVTNNGNNVTIVTDQIQKVSKTTGLPEFEEDGKTPIYIDVTRNYNLKDTQSLYNFVNQVINNSNLSTKVKNILKEKPASFWAASINNNN